MGKKDSGEMEFINFSPEKFFEMFLKIKSEDGGRFKVVRVEADGQTNKSA